MIQPNPNPPDESPEHASIIDSFGRVHTNLRISVTDRCNIRCFYCMPLENVNFRPRAELLTFDEIHRFVTVAARMGINKVRLTGGEPLVRREMWRLVEMLNSVPGINEVAMTTNAILLAKHAQHLRDAGLARLNISLDALDEAKFREIARRDGLDKVLHGIEVAQQVGFDSIKINTVAISDVNEDQVVPLARFCRERNLQLRFIEFMPLDAEANWQNSAVLSGESLRKIISDAVCELVPIDPVDPHQPAVDFEYTDGSGSVGFINSVSQPFCNKCNRLRITSEGQLQNCLFSSGQWDVRELLRNTDANDQQIAQLILDCVGAKAAGHGSNNLDFVRPDKAMYQIGG